MDSFLAWWDSTDLGDDPSTIEKLAKNKQEPITAETAEKLAHDLKAVEYVDCSALTRKGLKNVFDGAVLAALEPPDRGRAAAHVCDFHALWLTPGRGRPFQPTLARCGVLLLFPHPSTAPQTGAPKSRSLLPQPRGVQNVEEEIAGPQEQILFVERLITEIKM
ncbi:hypothetical protein GH733_001897 [Mirounga leonina]|nr:hypothetical protein GH733_001897 [Mirounga leonina]